MKIKEEQNEYTHILKSTSVFGGVQGLGIAISLLRNKLVAVLLGPEGMGLTTLFYSTIKLVSDSTNLGIAVSAVKNISTAYEAEDEGQLNQNIAITRLWAMLTAMLGMFICIAFSHALSIFTFRCEDKAVDFIILSPIVALTAVTGGELAILKGTRRLRSLAVTSLTNMVCALLLTTPMYYIWRQAAIVPSLLVVAVSQMLLTIWFSLKAFPFDYKLTFKKTKSLLSDGKPMIRLGIAFVLAGILGSGADFLIRTFLNTHGSLSKVGLFNAGYVMTMTYAGMVFSAMETDYFPRLSACFHDSTRRTQTVNRQIEVSLLIISPMLILFSITLPLLLPLLFSSKFLPIIGMVQVMVLAMYMRAIKLPIGYMPLANGDSKTFLLMESIYDALMVIAVVVCYEDFGLLGTGIAITIMSVVDFIMLLTCMHIRYGFRISRQALVYMAVHLTIAIGTYLVTFTLHGLLYWMAGIVLFIIGTAASICFLRDKTTVISSMKKRFKRK